MPQVTSQESLDGNMPPDGSLIDGRPLALTPFNGRSYTYVVARSATALAALLRRHAEGGEEVLENGLHNSSARLHL